MFNLRAAVAINQRTVPRRGQESGIKEIDMFSTLIILTRNEITGLKEIFKNIPLREIDECFVVDYRSTDGTREFLQKQKIKIIEQEKPGRAEAFRIGARKARGDIMVFFSPDGNENPKDIPLLIKKIAGGFDLVIASRFMKGARNEEDDKVLKWRKWANFGFTYLANLFWGGNVSDSINGYRAIRKKSFEKLKLDAQGFAIEYQMTIRAMKQKLKIAEIPTVEGNRIGGISGSAAIPTGLMFIYYLLREIFSDLVGTDDY